MKKMITTTIIDQTKIGENSWSLWLKAPGIADEVEPGQFVHVKLNQGEKLLPRPLSICEADREKNALRLVYAVVGNGTKDLSCMKVGETLSVMSPLGKGFKVDATVRKSILVGGGMGIPPLLELARRIQGTKEIYLGYSTTPFLVEEFQALDANVHISTDNGCVGHCGTVIDNMNQRQASGDRIYSCGPRPMLKALSAWAKEKEIPAQVSLEERMACGIGACLTCTCKIAQENQKEGDYQRVCADGPVFWSQEVVWDD